MLEDIVQARPLGQHRLFLQFEDGVEDEVDIAALVSFTGMLAPLADPRYFALVTTDADSGTIVWPNGADLDPDVLYATISGVPGECRLVGIDASWRRDKQSTSD